MHGVNCRNTGNIRGLGTQIHVANLLLHWHGGTEKGVFVDTRQWEMWTAARAHRTRKRGSRKVLVTSNDDQKRHTMTEPQIGKENTRQTTRKAETLKNLKGKRERHVQGGPHRQMGTKKKIKESEKNGESYHHHMPYRLDKAKSPDNTVL